ncbi:acyl-CoA dehydrogenase family protein [Nocardia stercoris]|uniref:Acyl-CoA dehydrogenase n=1 Tax=Nocardia stercoris TaxID=2483361 RepID=A0A3M2L2L3_9NOCA|nr:acyl-CoA dehydrogenase family protein [Nocardia stercoris]RMI31186.1 acyl-CoA dehydrogenase [Nocardia stercoris]
MSSPTPSRAELVERAAKLAPLLRSRAQWIDEHRRLPEDVITAIEESGLLRLQVPNQYGGYESDFRTHLDVLAEIARGNTSVAFCLSIYASLTWMTAFWPDAALDEVFATPNVRVTGTTAATGAATRVDGGYRLNGRWKFNSGVLHAHWKITAAVPDDPESQQIPIFAVVPVTELEIVDDWFTTGLEGSGSVTTVATDVFVPDHRVISGADFYQNISLSAVNGPKPIYTVPMLVSATVIQTGQLVGAARQALSGFLERLPGRPITYTDYTSQQDAPVTHLQVGEAALLIEDAEARARRFADRVDAKVASGEPWTQDERVSSRVQIGWIAKQAKQAVEILAQASGGSSIYRDVPIARLQRDIHAASLHGMITPAVNIELYGRTLCGLEPNTTYL